jgi:hypothetical protein
MKKLSQYDLNTIRYALLDAIGSLECDIRCNHVVNPKFETVEDRERERLGYARLGRFKNLLMRFTSSTPPSRVPKPPSRRR